MVKKFKLYIFSKKYRKIIDFAVKFQFRDLDTFIHQDYLNTDHPQVKRFTDHEKVIPNSIYIADGSNHMEISKTGSDYFLNKGNAKKVKGHCPSVDVLFNSAAKIKNSKLLAILLTGMGSDGAEGLNSLKNSGAFTVTQNEETSEVYGMPKAALEIGAAKCVLSLEQITEILSAQEVQFSC